MKRNKSLYLKIVILVFVIISCKHEIKNDVRTKSKYELIVSYINSNTYNPVNSSILPDSVFDIPVNIAVKFNKIPYSINFYESYSFESNNDFWGRYIDFMVLRHENTDNDIVVEYLACDSTIDGLPTMIIFRKNMGKACLISWQKTNIRVTNDSLVRIWEINKRTTKLFSNLDAFWIKKLFPLFANSVTNIKIDRIDLNYINTFFSSYLPIYCAPSDERKSKSFFSEIKILSKEKLFEERTVVITE